jgi:hypothetical protein
MSTSGTTIGESIEMRPSESKTETRAQSPLTADFSERKPNADATDFPKNRELMVAEETLQLVDWDGPEDPKNPKKYYMVFKYIIWLVFTDFDAS